jgi:very-short-patch-repair endonuclease
VFSGYLIEALRGGVRASLQESSTVSVNAIADYVRHRVEQHSSSRQAPGLGVLEFDDCGELYLSLHPQRAVLRPERLGRGRRDTPKRRRTDDASRPSIVPDRQPPSVSPDRRSTERPPDEPIGVAHRRAEATGLPDRTEGWVLDPALAAALDRHGAERRHGAHVLTVVAGDAMSAQTSWGTWAARQGYLTLASQSIGLDAVVADLLAQTPWLRCIPEARKRLAEAARIDTAAVDASLDARSPSERRTWTDDVAGLDPHARVSGWLLSWLRQPVARIPDLTAAPVRQGELLAIACDLVSPTAVLLFHPAPDERWLERAIVTATELIGRLPAHSVAVTAPEQLVSRVLRPDRRGAAWTMARQGCVRVDALARRLPGRAHHSTMRMLFEALEREPRTRGRFELEGRVVPHDGPAIDVALVAHSERIAVELDAWYHFHDPEGYRRDRVQDLRLARAGYFVLRFPTDDVDDRLASTIEHITIALTGRRAACALL